MTNDEPTTLVAAGAGYAVRRLNAATDADIRGLAEVLIDCVDGGASVSFTTPPPAYNTGDGQYGSDAAYSGVLSYYFEIGGPTSSVAVNAKALAFLRLASIRLMLRKLCNPA